VRLPRVDALACSGLTPCHICTGTYRTAGSGAEGGCAGSCVACVASARCAPTVVCLFVCLQPFVSPALWERAGNVPPLVRLLQARPIYGPPVRRLAVGSRRAGVARQSQRRCGPSRVSTTSKLRADRNKQTNEHTNPSGAGRLDTLCVASRTGVPAHK
jgi:hypothetical protein